MSLTQNPIKRPTGFGLDPKNESKSCKTWFDFLGAHNLVMRIKKMKERRTMSLAAAELGIIAAESKPID